MNMVETVERGVSKKSLLERLIEIQDAQGASDRDFGPQVGVAGAAWWNIRAGRRAIGPKVIQHVLNDYPELTDEVLDYLKGRTPISEPKREAK